jgi:hypothetical protein
MPHETWAYPINPDPSCTSHGPAQTRESTAPPCGCTWATLRVSQRMVHSNFSAVLCIETKVLWFLYSVVMQHGREIINYQAQCIYLLQTFQITACHNWNILYSVRDTKEKKRRFAHIGNLDLGTMTICRAGTAKIGAPCRWQAFVGQGYLIDTRHWGGSSTC